MFLDYNHYDDYLNIYLVDDKTLPHTRESQGKHIVQGLGYVREFWNMSVKIQTWKNIQEKSGESIFFRDKSDSM